jgi:hypothetical protein
MQTPEAPPPLAGAPGSTNAANIVLPEWITYLMWGAVAFAALWLISTVFIHMRRRATNLTSAQQAGVNKNATPDFMKVDHKARDEAMKRGAAYDQELVEREKAAAAAAAGEKLKKEPVGIVKMISGVAAFLFSLFTLLGAIVGTFRTLDSAGVQLSKMDQVGAVLTQHPIPSIICVFVIGYTIFLWVSQKKWTQPAKI